MINSNKSETKWYKALRLTPTLLSLSIPLFLLFLAADIKCCRIRLSSEQSFVAWDVFLLLRIIEAWLLRLQQRQQDQHYPTGAVIFFLPSASELSSNTLCLKCFVPLHLTVSQRDFELFETRIKLISSQAEQLSIHFKRKNSHMQPRSK